MNLESHDRSAGCRLDTDKKYQADNFLSTPVTAMPRHNIQLSAFFYNRNSRIFKSIGISVHPPKGEGIIIIIWYIFLIHKLYFHENESLSPLLLSFVRSDELCLFSEASNNLTTTTTGFTTILRSKVQVWHRQFTTENVSTFRYRLFLICLLRNV